MKQVTYSNNFEFLTFAKDVNVHKDMFYEVSLGILPEIQYLNSPDCLTFQNEELPNLREIESLKFI